MAHLTRTRIALLAAAFLILIAGAFYLALLAIPNERSLRASVIQHLSEWTGATVSITGRTRLSYFPRPVLVIPKVKLSGIQRLPALHAISAKRIDVRLGLWSLISSMPVIDRVTFVEPQIVLNSAGEVSPENTAQQLVRTLESAPFGQIRLENGVLTVAGSPAREQFTAINAKINLQQPGGAHSSRGTFAWRGQTVAFRYDGEERDKEASTLTFPVSISIEGDLVSAEIRGKAVIRDGLRINGNLELEIANLPRFARWTGVLVPEDQETGDFSASGTFHWEGHRIGFDEGSFELDGNRALGAMTLDIAGPRPQIEGTLALQKLDLTQYFEPGSAPPGKTKSATAPGEEKSIDVGFPLLHHINIDLRISTTELTALPLSFGQSALSVTLNAGRLAADIAFFELCGGNGNIRLEFDASVPDTAVRLTANIIEVSAQTCIGIFTDESILEGAANLVLDITSKGRTAKELLDSLGGKVALSMSAGQADVDVAKLISGLPKGPVKGWSAARGDRTSFESLTGEFFLRRGGAYTDSLKLDLGEKHLTGEGTIGLTAQELDMRMRLVAAPPKDAPADANEQKPAGNLTGDIVIKGPWSDPSFALEPAKKNSVAPSPAQTRTAHRGQLYR